MSCFIIFSQVFFLKVDGNSTDGMRWQDGSGALNFTWLRAAPTSASSFDSVALFEATDEERSAMARLTKGPNKKSFFSRQREEEEEENEQDVKVQRAVAARREKMMAKIGISQSIDTWVMCPFRF